MGEELMMAASELLASNALEVRGPARVVSIIFYKPYTNNPLIYLIYEPYFLGNYR
jgi:hypothetical protein